jgi:uncharacterized lipoprotein YmbA
LIVNLAKWAVLVPLVAMTACSAPPRERFYTLDAPEPPAAAEAPYSIAVGKVSVPELVDRPQFVVRVGANQVAIAEQARWAEPLKSAIARVVAANLAKDLGARTLAQPGNGDADYRVLIDVQRFESSPGESVLIDAQWTVIGPKGARRTARSNLRERVQGRDYDALAAAHSAALATLSREIAAAIRQP